MKRSEGGYRSVGQQAERYWRAAASYWCTYSCAGLLVVHKELYYKVKPNCEEGYDN